MNHPVLSALAAIDAALDEIAGLDPIYLSTADKQAALATATKVRSRVEALQTRVLAAALDALPVALGDARRGKAETFMLDKAAEFGPGELRNLGRGLLEYLAPDIADEHELRLLRAEDDRARAATKFTFRSRGDGITDINARVADHVAHRLKA